MMPEEWPIAASAADGTAGASLAGRTRLSTIRRDFFLDPAKRLTEQERALMTAMLHSLAGEVADAIRASLPGGRAAANDDGDAELIATLSAAGLLDEPGLIGLLLRRADEERISAAARARRGRRDARVLQGLVSHDYGAAAASAMALILARGRRRDRFGRPLIAFDDLSSVSADALVHAVAAGLRLELTASKGIAGADLELSEASTRVLGERDEERGVEALTSALVHFLDEGGGLTDELILAAANEGEIAFVADFIARRSGISPDSAIDELLAGDSERVMALFRCAVMSRDLCTGLLAGIGDILGIADAGTALATFDRISGEEIDTARSWLATDPAYRAALERLGQGRG